MSPERTCVGCRGKAAPADLVRLVVDPCTQSVVVDVQRRLPGRGAYVHPDADCLALAIRRRAVQRALRAPDVETTVLSALAAAYANRDGSA